jgi:hypothetical protein
MDSTCRQSIVELLNLASRFNLLDGSFIFERTWATSILNYGSHINHTLISIPQYRERFYMRSIQGKL